MRSFAGPAALGIAILFLPGMSSHVAAQVNACSLITREEAAGILGKPEIARAQVISVDEEDCGYLLSGFDIHTELLRSIPGWSSWKNSLVKEDKAEAVDGIGEEAAFTIDGNGDSVLVARKGNRIVSLTMYRRDATAAEAKPKLVKLLTVAMTKLN